MLSQYGDAEEVEGNQSIVKRPFRQLMSGLFWPLSVAPLQSERQRYRDRAGECISKRKSQTRLALSIAYGDYEAPLGLWEEVTAWNYGTSSFDCFL